MKYFIICVTLLLFSCGGSENKTEVKELDYNLLFIDDFNPKLDESEFFQKNMAKKQINENERLEVIKRIFESGTSVDSLDVNGETPLFKSVKYGYLKISEFLIEKGANVNFIYSKDESHTETPLWASLQNCLYKQHRDIAKLLIEKGANKDILIDGMSPTNYIEDKKQFGNTECAELLQYFK
jgi:ankyrin repeat protein